MEGRPQLTLESVAQVVQELQGQLASARSQIASQQALLQDNQEKLNAAARESAQSRHMISTVNQAVTTGFTPKVNTPPLYKGKGSITSWTTHMSNYLANVDDAEALNIAVSYLHEGAHEWWIMYQRTDEGREVNTWTRLKNAMVSRFDVLNKEKIARDKLAKWRQIKDVVSFNEDFQKIILEIPGISTEEQIDRYTRGLKPYIWKELCTKDYKKLADAMRDAERIESAHRRGGTTPRAEPSRRAMELSNKPTPMEIGNIELKKLTPEERQRCIKEGLCLRCRQKGHIARDCPKGKRN